MFIFGFVSYSYLFISTECWAGCQEPGSAEHLKGGGQSNTAAFERLQVREESWDQEKDNFMAVSKLSGVRIWTRESK